MRKLSAPSPEEMLSVPGSPGAPPFGTTGYHMLKIACFESSPARRLLVALLVGAWSGIGKLGQAHCIYSEPTTADRLRSSNAEDSALPHNYQSR